MDRGTRRAVDHHKESKLEGDTKPRESRRKGKAKWDISERQQPCSEKANKTETRFFEMINKIDKENTEGKNEQ